MNIKVNRKAGEIIITKGDAIISLTESEYDKLYKTAETEFYYRSDVEKYFALDNDNGYNNKAVLNDKVLVNAMVDDYAARRFDHDTGDPDSMESWIDCLYDTIEEFEDELKKYKL